ncbi:sulfide-quinone reductase [Nanobdella aerobiophila]|uniref:Sulfide-quinone reductase n=1 Tax=Nanobdella aerobiophila TaxID=2586965 RepID=A0A915WRS4_9ARCH|nr:FAD-dependent oxidoreductase [Nanobdella aerobiophila]BBL45534.1 sulfide-quinone reductase [Nanobdella aerobiophila]
MVKVLVLGARFGGLSAAYTLRRITDKNVEIKVINKSKYTYFRPAFPHLAVGYLEKKDIEINLEQELPKKDIEFQEGEVTKIDAKKKLVYYTTNGKEVKEDYDYLIIALGAHLSFEEIKGFEENGFSVCEPEYALKLRERLKNWDGGTIAIGSGKFHQGSNPKPEAPETWTPRADSACEGPVFELSIMLRGYFAKKGVLDKTKFIVFSPGEYLSDLSNENRSTVNGLYKSLGIELINGFVVKEIDKDKVISEDGKEIKADLTIILPPYSANPVLKNSTKDLVDDAGFVITNKYMQSINYPEVYAVGDSNAITVPKLGYLAVMSARVAATHLARTLGYNVEQEEYNPMVVCVADNPYENMAIEVNDNSWYGGNIKKATPSKIAHLKKEMFTKYYIWSKGDMALEKFLASW